MVESPPSAVEGPRHRNKRGEGERLRADLIASASRLLETVGGEEALSLRAVARGAGVAAPSIYPHFADKHELVLAVLAARFAELRETLDRAAASVEGPAAQLRARCNAYCRFAAEQPGNYRVMFDAIPARRGTAAGILPVAGLLPATGIARADLSDLADLPGAETLTDLVRAVDRCIGEGIDGPFDTFEAACLVWAMLHGLVTLRMSKPAFPWPPRRLMIDQILHAVCGLDLPR